jgi:two-component system, NarL family, nitrate/nitrite response regulator NarL
MERMSDPIGVAVIDDHPLFREGVIQVIGSSKFFKVVGEGATADDAVRIAKGKLPDILLLDVNLPGGGIQAARAIARACPAVKTIMLTVSEREEHFTQALQAGVRGYVLKGTSGTELLNGLYIVSRGQSYVTPGLVARLLTHLKRPQPAPVPNHHVADLKDRERQMLDHVARGLTNKEIGNHFAISEKTVKHYMTIIMQKLHARNRVEAVALHRKTSEGVGPIDERPLAEYLDERA